jgi:subtilisin family serine protease
MALGLLCERMSESAKPGRKKKVPVPTSPEPEKDQKKQREQITRDMMRSIVTEPLLSQVKAAKPEDRFDVIISLNELFSGGVEAAMKYVVQRAADWKVKYHELMPYLFACLTAQQILDLAQEARDLTAKYGRSGSVVYRIWEDQEINTTLTRSLSTVKADAAQRAFQAFGEGIVWAVLDSGIQGDHPHFKDTQPQFKEDSLSPVVHRDYTPDGRNTAKPDDPPKSDPSALIDRFGHGTHVAGIIAGCWTSSDPKGELVVGTEMRDESTDKTIPQRGDPLRFISGVAPKTKLVSLKVIADVIGADATAKQTPGQGKVSWVLMAIDQIQRWNQYGKRLLIHGVNMSLGYDFDPRWFACGQSPLCVEVDRLVRSGVAVVVSAGNGGYSSFVAASGLVQSRYSDLSITDPGNADMAITVGSTHREKPHLYGVSYFSSRGPTGDGRMKPDLLAPGERIISCAAGAEAQKYKASGLPDVLYCELSGTSMAAPHVSGAIAAFLSVRSEFIGEPEQVKEIFKANTIDLHRAPTFQGAGLMDLMKVLQSV